MGRPDFVFESFDGLGLVRVVILVVQRQVTDLHLLEREIRRRQFYNGVRQLAIERISARRLPTITAILYWLMMFSFKVTDVRF